MSSKIQSLAFVAAEEDALDELAVVRELVAVRACCPGSRTCACFAVSRKDSKQFPLSQFFSCLVFSSSYTRSPRPHYNRQGPCTCCYHLWNISHLTLLRVEDDTRFVPRHRHTSTSTSMSTSTSNTCHFLGRAYSHRR